MPRNSQTENRPRSRAARLWGAVVLLGIVGVVVLAILVRGPGRTGSKQDADRGCGRLTGYISEGETIPASCKIELLESASPVTLTAFRTGKPMVLNFWASWCPFCIKEMPDFQRVSTALDDQVRFLGLDLLAVQGETKSAAAALAARTGVHYPLGYDEGGVLYFRIAPRLLMPTTVFVRADGIVAYRQYGPLDAAKLRSMIKQYLGV